MDPNSPAKTAMVGVRFDGNEMKKIEAAAKAQGLTVSRWCRGPILEAVNQPQGPVALAQALQQVGAGAQSGMAARPLNARASLLQQLQERNPAVTTAKINPGGETITVTENLAKNPNVVIVAGPAFEVRRTWTKEWARMASMEPGEAEGHFAELRAGRPLPQGFKAWPKLVRIEWLDREWPL